MRYFRMLAGLTLAALSTSGYAAIHAAPRHERRIAREEDRFDFSLMGAPAPSAALVDAQGRSVTIASFRGHPILVNLWATWCLPCIRELPALDRSAALYRGKVAIIAVIQDMQGAPLVLPFWRSHDWKSLTVLMNPRGGLATAANMGGLPATIVYDASGHEVWRTSGGTDWSSPVARQMIRRAG